MCLHLWLLVSLFVQNIATFLIYDGKYGKNRDLLWETWFNPFQTVPSHTIYFMDNTFIAYEQSTIIDSLFIGTFQLRKLSNGSYIVGNVVNNTKLGVIGLVYMDANECKLLGWHQYSAGCFLALKKVDPNNCTDNTSDDYDVKSASCVLVISSENVEDIFTNSKYTIVGSISAEIPMQRLDVSAVSKCLYFVSRNFDESTISKHQHRFRDYFNYKIHSYSLVDNKITGTLTATFTSALEYLSAPLWIMADLVPKCLTLVHYDDNGFLVLNIIEYENFRHLSTVTLGGIQSGSIIEFSKTVNTPKIVAIGDTPPYEKIIILNGITGEIQRHDVYLS